MIIKYIKTVIAWTYDFSNRIRFNRKISKIYRGLEKKGKIEKRVIDKHKKLWAGFGSKPNIKWLCVYISINNIIDYRYITEYDYYFVVEPRLNSRVLSEAYCDKNVYHNTLNKQYLPKIYLRNIDHVFYDEQYRTIPDQVEMDYIKADYGKVVVKKALESGGGRGVVLFEFKNYKWIDNSGNELTKQYLKDYFKKNYIIQEYIEQHPYYKQFNESSVNTVRLFTYRSVKTNEIIPIQSVLRIGKPGAVVDNQASGGVAVGIQENGFLNPFAINKKGNKLYTYYGVSFKDTEPIFMYDEILEIGKTLAKQFYYHRLLGFDFSVDINGEIKLIEVNNRNNEINFYQMNNGPLFKEYTDEIIHYCKTQKKPYSFDFDV